MVAYTGPICSLIYSLDGIRATCVTFQVSGSDDLLLPASILECMQTSKQATFTSGFQLRLKGVKRYLCILDTIKCCFHLLFTCPSLGLQIDIHKGKRMEGKVTGERLLCQI